MRLGIGVLVFIFWCSSLISLAQAPTAVVNGQVRDTSGSAIPNASVEVINDATNLRYVTETNDEGIFSVPNVPPGTYHIRVSKQGFKTIVHPDITLNVQDAKAIGFTLPVGPISDTVTVEGGAPLINTQDAAVSTVVDRKFVENMPMNGRSFQTLIQLSPGVVAIPSNPLNGGQFSINGQRGSSNYWMVDGVSANVGIGVAAGGNGLGGSLGSFSVLGGTNSLVSVDSLEEFRIQTSTYAPEFGRTPGGQISIATRSGTNQFHGTLFDYFRNDVLDANNWFNTSVTPPLAKAEERQNDFGGTLGGPILKDRTFFFFSYEGLRLRLPQTALSTVPCDSSCQVFGNARTMAVSAMQPYLNAYPLPNGPEVFRACTPNVNGCPASGQRPTGAAQYDASFSNPATLNAYSIRVDHRLGNTLNFFGRYNYSPSEIVQRGVTLLSLNTISTTSITTQTATLGATWTLSPSVTSDLRFNYSRTSAHGFDHLDSFGGAVPLTVLPFPTPFNSQNAVFTFYLFPLQGGILEAGEGGDNLQRQINIVGSASIQTGAHALKVGIDFRRLSPQTASGGQYQQFYGILNVRSAETGSLFFANVGSSKPATLHLHNIGIYAQDTWHIVPGLTVNYGLRWDFDLAPSSNPALPAVAGFNLNDLSALTLAPAGVKVYGTTYGNVALRLGVAYQLSKRQSWQTVLRGGFGAFYDLATSELGNNVSTNDYPFGNVATIFGGTLPLSPGQLAPPPITPPNASNNGILFAIDPHLKLPYTLEWNVAAEQGLGRQQTLSVSYLGAAGRRLLQQGNVSPVNANFSTAELLSNASTSDYDALQVQFRRQMAHGLQALASYTWSHSIDTASAGAIYGSANALLPSVTSQDRGPSDFDLRHTLSAAMTYDLPALKVSALTKALLGGWSTQNAIVLRSASPVGISDASFSQLPGGFSTQVRPDLVSGRPLYLYGSQYPGGKAFNPNAFTDPPSDPNTGLPLRQGNMPRNLLRGFGAAQWDFAVHRDFPIHESLRLQFRAEMFNVLNHPNFGPQNGTFGSLGFGLSNQLLSQSLSGSNLGGGGFSPLYQMGGPRSIQFALKLVF